MSDNQDAYLHPPTHTSLPDAVLHILNHRLGAMANDMGKLESAMKDVATAMTKLALVEERQAHAAGRLLLRMKQMPQVFRLMRAYFEQVFIAADQLANALIPPLDGTVSYADETLSARAYRAHRDGKVLGKLFMPIINLLFFWQGPDHCKNAYTKEFDRKNYPSEYQPPNQPRYTSRNVAPPSRVRP